MSLRVASLFPAATEIACAIGAESELVGVSHECDYPPGVRALPVLTRSRVRGDVSDRAIDAQVRDLSERGQDLYEVDAEALRRAAPDLVLAQELCEVCAVSPASVRSAVADAGLGARVVVLHGDALATIAQDAIDVGEALDRPEAGHAVAHEFEKRLAEIQRLTRDLPRPRVASLEWLDPPFAAGHWVPQMVRLAGGEEVLGEEAKRSRRVEWSDVEESDPEVICVMPCGFDVERSRGSWEAARARLSAERSRLSELEVLLLNASSLFSRPGPRLVRGVEVLAALLHPEAGFQEPSLDEGVRAP